MDAGTVRRRATFATFLAAGVLQSVWFGQIVSVGTVLGLRVDEYWTLIMTFALAGVGGAVLGPVVDRRIGTRRALLGGIALMGLGQLSIGVTVQLLHSLPGAIVSVAFATVGYGLVDITMNIEGSHLERIVGRSLMPRFHAGFSAGAAIGSGIALGAVVTASGPLIGFIAGVLVGATVLFAARLRPRVLAAERSDPFVSQHTIDEEDGRSRARLRDAVGHPAVLLLALAAFCFSSAEGAAVSLIALGTEQGHQRTAVEGSVAYGVFVLGMLTVRYVGGSIADRFGAIRVLVAAAAVAAGGVVAFVLGGAVVLQLGALFWGAGVAVAMPLLISVVARGHAAVAAPRVALVSIGAYVAAFVSPPALDLLAGPLGILGALALVAVALVPAGVIVTLVQVGVIPAISSPDDQPDAGVPEPTIEERTQQ